MLGLKLADRGIEGEPFAIGDSRPLAPADFELLAAGAGSAPAPLQRLRARHHALAKSLAEGMRPGVAAAAHGFSVSRVSILQADPSFKELMEHYRSERDADYSRINGRLVGIAVDALDEISVRLEDSPEEVKMHDLIKLAALAADRTGHGPSSKSDVNVFVGFGQRLHEAQQRLGKILDVTPNAIAAE